MTEETNSNPTTTETTPDVEKQQQGGANKEEATTTSPAHPPKYANMSSDMRRSGMESSILKFSNVNFTVGKGDKKKYLLTDVNATVKYGRVLAST